MSLLTTPDYLGHRPAGGSMAQGSPVVGGVATAVLYIDGSGNLASDSGFTQSSSALTFRDDTDITATLGRARIDSRTTDRAHFSHRDQAGTAAYLAMQRADGTGGINAPTGQSIGLSIQAVNVLTIEGTQITLAQKLKFVAGLEQTTVGAAGAASALPAQPSKYFRVLDSAGTSYVVPGYLQS